MTWMETCRLLGVDLFVVMLIVVAALNGIERVVHSAFRTGPWHR